MRLILTGMIESPILIVGVIGVFLVLGIALFVLSKKLILMVNNTNTVNSLFTAILNSSPEMLIYALDKEYKYLSYNKKHQEAMKDLWNIDISIGSNMLNTSVTDNNYIKLKTSFDRALNGESFAITEEYDHQLGIIWQNYYSPIYSEKNEIIGLTCFVFNVTEQKRVEKELKENEFLLRKSQQTAHIGSFMYYNDSKRWLITEECKDIIGIEQTYPRTKESLHPLIHPEWMMRLREYYMHVKQNKQRFDYKFKIIRNNDRKERWVHGMGEFEYTTDGEMVRLIGTLQDITEQMYIEEEVRYLSYHDKLTGLYNRRYFEEEMKRIDKEAELPITIIFGDVNGLKLTNDIFGHKAGDQFLNRTAEILKKNCQHGTLARVGGDEFAILLPKTTRDQARVIVDRVKEDFTNEKNEIIQSNISIGFETKEIIEEDLENVMETAEGWMYQEKALHKRNYSEDMIARLMHSVHSKSPYEVHHSSNVSDLCYRMGLFMGKNETELRKLKEVGYLHDIGKVAVDEKILNKNGEFTKEEREQMKQHTVVGYRILNLFDHTVNLADIVLNHHEYWDGTGYPKGISGDEIPEEARIISIVEVYDAITNKMKDHPKNKEFAVNEIKSIAGKKLDPNLVDSFIQMIASQNA